ncbi:MAG: tRNA pseudouridine(55) synthase TruB [Cyclobacteriaceae bacterium]
MELDGQLILVDKALEWTSFDVVNKLRYALKVKKIGHAGTLDPLATGLLLVGVGKYTKKLGELQGLDKTYEGEFEIGKTTPSFDLETEFDSETDVSHITEDQMHSVAKQLSGDIEQVPPTYSAIRVGGERAYKAAREKRDIKLQPRSVTIHEFAITGIEGSVVSFRIGCSKGTYIRSIASDFGKELGVGAYLKRLRRTSVGDYHVKDAFPVEYWVDKFKVS